MTGGFRFPRFGHLAVLVTAAFALGGPFGGCMGGTGTDTDNGVYVTAQVVNSSGAPVHNVELSVLELGTRADSVVNDPLWREEPPQLVTDNTGTASFILKEGGVYMTTGKRGDSIVFLDTLRVKKPGTPDGGFGAGTPQFVVETPARAAGRIRMYSGLEVDTGRVMLRGTLINASLGDSGTYNLGWLPPSVQKTVVTLTYKGRVRERRFVKLSAEGGQLTAFASNASGPCLADTLAAVTPAFTRSGTPSSAFDVARAVSKACAHRVGAEVTVLEVNGAGAVLRARGTYVIPAREAPDFWGTPELDTAAVPTACLEPSNNLTTGLTGRSTLRLMNNDIVVDDFKSGKGCLE